MHRLAHGVPGFLGSAFFSARGRASPRWRPRGREECLHGMRTVVAFGGEAKELETFSQAVAQTRRGGIRNGLRIGFGTGRSEKERKNQKDVVKEKPGSARRKLAGWPVFFVCFFLLSFVFKKAEKLVLVFVGFSLLSEAVGELNSTLSLGGGAFFAYNRKHRCPF